MMIDAFDAENGATRFVPGSHLQPDAPSQAIADPNYVHEKQALACGPAGSIIIFNGSAWHGHTANRSDRRRRSVQGHYIPRLAKASVDHHARMRPEVLARIGDIAKYVLAIERYLQRSVHWLGNGQAFSPSLGQERTSLLSQVTKFSRDVGMRIRASSSGGGNRLQEKRR
jgi:ectoine hydroxylase-related dioxygenase (phytanoyl-CoA dioxygenase family)